MILLGSKIVYPAAKVLAEMKMTKSDFDKLCTAQYVPILHSIENLFNNLTNDAYLVSLTKAEHMSFSDYSFLLPVRESGIIAPLEGIEVTRKLVVGFFDVYLKNKDRSQFIAMLKDLPEITEKIKIRK